MVPVASILILPPSCETVTLESEAPASTTILASSAVTVMVFPFAFSFQVFGLIALILIDLNVPALTTSAFGASTVRFTFP